MDEGGQEIDLDDEIFEDEDSDVTLDATFLHDEPVDKFVQGSVDAEDLATGFSATIPTREIDVDEDTQGDEVLDAIGEEPLTEFEVSGTRSSVIHGDEIELDLDEALATGSTIAKAPEDE